MFLGSGENGGDQVLDSGDLLRNFFARNCLVAGVYLAKVFVAFVDHFLGLRCHHRFFRVFDRVSALLLFLFLLQFFIMFVGLVAGDQVFFFIIDMAFEEPAFCDHAFDIFSHIGDRLARGFCQFIHVAVCLTFHGFYIFFEPAGFAEKLAAICDQPAPSRKEDGQKYLQRRNTARAEHRLEQAAGNDAYSCAEREYASAGRHKPAHRAVTAHRCIQLFLRFRLDARLSEFFRRNISVFLICIAAAGQCILERFAACVYRFFDSPANRFVELSEIAGVYRRIDDVCYHFSKVFQFIHVVISHLLHLLQGNREIIPHIL